MKFRRLIYALSRNEIEAIYDDDDDNQMPIGDIGGHTLVIRFKDSKEKIGRIDFRVYDSSEGNPIEIFVEMLEISKKYRNTKAVMYLLEEFKKFLDASPKSKVTANIAHPELEEWLKKYTEKYNIEFENFNEEKGLDAITSYVMNTLKEFLIIDYDLPKPGEKEISFRIENIPLKSIETLFKNSVVVGNPKQFKKYFKYALENGGQQYILFFTRFTIESAIEKYLEVADISFNLSDLYFNDLKPTSFEFDISDTKLSIYFTIPVPEESKKQTAKYLKRKTLMRKFL